MYNRSNQRIIFFSYLIRKKIQTSTPPYFFGYGRTALKVGILSLKLPEKKKDFCAKLYL